MTEQAATLDERSALETARLLDIDLNRLYVILRLGRLAGRKVNGQWRISSHAIEERLRERATAAK